MAPALRNLSFRPLTLDNWEDLEALFGEKGACGGCWCMWWRLKRSEFENSKGAGNKRALKTLVRQGVEPGILAYHREEPVGWCAVQPRSSYPVLDRSRILKPVDARPVWSVTCFFIRRDRRGSGLSTRLLGAVLDHVRRRGGTLVEGYPTEPRKKPMPDVFAWTGIASTFTRNRFREVARRSPGRPIYRRTLRPVPQKGAG